MAQIFASERGSPTHRVAQRGGEERSGPSSDKIAALQRRADQGAAQRMEDEEALQGKFSAVQLMDEEEPLQGKFAQFSDSPVLQRQGTGSPLPKSLQAGTEALSGHAMSDVRVHYNSDAPAQLNAHAYAQGSDIHLGPGQEQHLPHETWHVVQQREGRVQPTMDLAGTPVNDDPSLESEADRMGDKARKGPF